MKTKLNDIKLASLSNSYDIIVATETWLDDTVLENELFDTRYNVYRRDRSSTCLAGKGGGGVLIAVSKSLSSKRVNHFESIYEDLWVSVNAKVHGKVVEYLFCAVYLPPPVKPNVLEIFLENCNVVMQSSCNRTVILGDFNLGFIDWVMDNQNKKMIPSNYSSTLGYQLIDFLSLNNLSQFNSVKNKKSRILDLALSNSNDLHVTESQCQMSKLDSHHPALEINMNVSTDPLLLKNKTFATHNFKKADYSTVNLKLSQIDWDSELDHMRDVDAMVSKFYDIINKIIVETVPKTNVRNLKYPIWFTRNLIKIIKEKERIRKKFKIYKNPRDGLELKICNRRVKTAIANCYSAYVKEIEVSIRHNPKKFWSFVRRDRGNSSGIPEEMHLSGKIASGGEGICNLFAEHFSSIFSKPDNTLPTDCVDSYPQISLNCIEVTEHQIRKLLNSIDDSKGAGPDGIPPLFIKKTSKHLVCPLKLIFEKSLKSGIFPSVWKRSNVIPIFKKGNKDDVTNYRPVSIISLLAKVFECVVCPVMTSHFKNIISDAQHGFCRSKSTVSNLMTYVTDITKSVDSQLQVDSIYTDFSGAFDKVDHKILLSKLGACGIHGDLLRWLSSYLKDRIQSVIVHGFKSNDFIALSGVPQGSHLGPILFLVFLNDICNNIKYSQVSIFADDLKLYKCIKDWADVSLLQADLDTISEWCVRNKMKLNPLKCNHIKFTRKKNIVESCYSISGQIVEESTKIRDLGVLLDDKLNFIEHIDNIITRSWKMLGFVKRVCKDFKNIHTLKIIYNALIRSNLEYASTIWNPIYEVHSLRIERIQKNFTRHLAYKSRDCPRTADYDVRLSHFLMTSLAGRRKLLDLMTLHKLVHGNLVCPSLLKQINLTVPYHIPRHPIANCFNVPRCRTNLGRSAPLYRCMRTYNDFDTGSVDIFHDSERTFKRKCVALLNLECKI